MAYKAVIGLGFGDEGKGLFTDYLCSQSQAPLVTRFSGGQQAGHTVVVAGVRHVFSNFGAGTLRNAPSYFSRFCTIDPIGIVNELGVLLDKGIKPTLYIDEHCPVTTPLDVQYNRQNHAHGSCGLGVGATFNREAHFYSLTFGDLFYPWVLKTKLDLIQNFYQAYTDVSLENFLSCCEIITHCDYIHKTRHFPKMCRSGNRMLHHGDQTQPEDQTTNKPLPDNHDSDIIFEGSQGLLLDQHYGFFPHVTRGNTGTQNIIELCGDTPFSCYLVTRAYQTRHGLGPMSNESLPHNILKDANETNQTNLYQGEFRRTLLDVSLLEYALQKDPYITATDDKYLVITCLDHIRNEYRFTYQGGIVYCHNEQEFAARIARLLNIKNLYLSVSCESKNIRPWFNVF